MDCPLKQRAQAFNRLPTQAKVSAGERGLSRPWPAAITRCMDEPSFFALPDGRRIAYRFTPGHQPGPVTVFLPGYKSDMGGSKAQALFDQARATGQSCLLLDYSGCGLSSGAFGDGTLSRWRDEVVALIDQCCADRPVLLVGSSMGGWLMLLVARARPAQVDRKPAADVNSA